MVRSYKRITEPGDGEAMRRAIRAANNGETIRQAALDFGVSKSALHRYLHKEISAVPDKISSGRFRTVFSAEQEDELVREILALGKRFFAMTRNIVRRLAYDLAEANNLPHPFKNGQAGYDWSYHFLQRHQDQLSIRTAQPLSLQRLFGFRKSSVYLFFDNLEHVIHQRGFTPENIYNCDESGFTIVTSRSPKVFAQRGARVVSTIKPVERGRLVSMMACASAAGDFVPPFYVFAGNPNASQHAKVALGPAGAQSSNSKKGWMTTEVFIDWLQHFRDYVNPSESRKILLVLDNHGSHVTYEAVKFARENYIDMVTLPPHTSHKLQPLDVGFFGPLKQKFDEAMTTWQNNHRYQKAQELDLPAIMKVPYEQTARPEVARNAFRKTGIWVPYSNGPDRTVFHPDEFLPEEDMSQSAGEANRRNEHEDQQGPPGSGNDNSNEGGQDITLGEDVDDADEPQNERSFVEMVHQPDPSNVNALSTNWDSSAEQQHLDLLFFSPLTVTEDELRRAEDDDQSPSSVDEDNEVSMITTVIHPSDANSFRSDRMESNRTPALPLVPYSVSPSPDRGSPRRGSGDSISSNELQGLPVIMPDFSSNEGSPSEQAVVTPPTSTDGSISNFTVPPSFFRPIEPEAPKAKGKQKHSVVATSDESFHQLEELKQLKERKAAKSVQKQSSKPARKVKSKTEVLKRSILATKKSLASQARLAATRVQPSRSAKKQ